MRRVIIVHQAALFVNKPCVIVGKTKGLWKTRNKLYSLRGAENGITLLWGFVVFLFSNIQNFKKT